MSPSASLHDSSYIHAVSSGYRLHFSRDRKSRRCAATRTPRLQAQRVSWPPWTRHPDSKHLAVCLCNTTTASGQGRNRKELSMYTSEMAMNWTGLVLQTDDGRFETWPPTWGFSMSPFARNPFYLFIFVWLNSQDMASYFVYSENAWWYGFLLLSYVRATFLLSI